MKVAISGGIVRIDHEDADLLRSRTWHIDKGYVVTRGKDGEPAKIGLHRLIAAAADGQIVDHINGDPSDNRRDNLRLCSHAENARNRKVHRNNKSGVKGAQACSDGRYRARITVNGRRIELGSFRTAEEAGKAYSVAASRLFGEFSRIS